MNEPVQSGSASDGRGIVLWVPTIEDTSKPTVAELTATTVKRLTYGLTRDGFVLEVSINNITIGRYTLAQDLVLEGTKSYNLTTIYPYNRTTPTEAEGVLGEKGAEGNFVHILGYPNDHEIAAGTKVNAIVPARIGSSTDTPPTQNAELTKRMVPEIIGEVQTEVTVVA